MRTLTRAWRYVSSVDLIDVGELQTLGVRCVLLDRDNTLVPRDTKIAPPEVSAWLESLKDAGISRCMVSNNFHTKAVEASAEDLDMLCVHHAMKPSPVAVRLALSVAGVPAEQAVLIGDQVFTDIVAANLAGVRSILVRPQSEVDLWYTQLFRKVEWLFFRGVTFEGEDEGVHTC